MGLQIFLLGQAKLLYHSQPIKFVSPPRTLPLMAYLLLRGGETIERQQVACQLWPDEPEEAARANLRRHIYQLIHALPSAAPDAPWLLLTTTTVQWNPNAGAWLDVAEFERLCACTETLPEAIRLYGGDLLENVYDDWAFFERERLRELYFTGLSRLVFHYRTQRNYPAALEFAQQLIARDPFREGTLRQIIALRYEMGDRAGAIREYEQFAHRLNEEMAVAPMPETQAVYEVVLRNGRLPGIGGQPVESQNSLVKAADRAAALPFVGRESELEKLCACWNRAAQGMGGLVLISGEAGIGKTRLAQELALRVEDQGGRVLHGSTAPGEPRPYQAFVEALHIALPILASIQGIAHHLAALAVLVPEIYKRLGIRKAAELSPEQERIHLFDSLATCLSRLAEPRPVLLILEDLHWAGKATTDLLEFLARWAVQYPVLILGSYREEDTPRPHPLRDVRRRLQAEELLDSLSLGRFSAAAVDALLAEPVVREGLPSLLTDLQLANHVYDESEGNPLFIELLFRHWREVGEIMPGARAGGIRAVVLQQMEGVSPKVQAYAEVAAVVGPAFNSEVVREVGGWSEAQALDALKVLLDHRLVSDMEGRSILDYNFSHHLIQATLYGEIPPDKRKRRHLRTAEVLEELYPEKQPALASELAHHYDQGGDAPKAVTCYLQAVRQFLSMFADSEALAAVNRALELVDTPTGPAESRTRMQLLLLREAVHSRLSNRLEQKADLDRLDALAAELGDTELGCQVLERQILYHRMVGETLESRELTAVLQCRADAMGSIAWKAVAFYFDGLGSYNESCHSEAIRSMEQALNCYTALGNRQGQLKCCCALAEIAVQTRKVSQVEYWTQRANDLFDNENPPNQLLHTYWSIAAAGLIKKDLQSTLFYGQKLLAMAERCHDLTWQAHAHRLLGQADRRLFRMEDSRRHLDSALAIYTRLQRPKGRALALETLAILAQALGQFAEAHENNRKGLAIHERLNHPGNVAVHLINMAETYAMEGRYVEAKDAACRALAVARQAKNRFLEACALQVIGKSERELGDLPEAIRCLCEARGFFHESAQQIEYVSALADLSLAHWKAGERGAAVQAAEEVVDLFPQVDGQDEEVHFMLWAAVQVLHASGQPERAIEWLAQAYRVVTEHLAGLTEPRTQESYRQIAENRQILAAYEQGQWPEGLRAKPSGR